MNKRDIAKIFETDIANVESYKKEQILKHAVQIVQEERGMLIELMADWIKNSNPSKIELAVLVAQELELIELIPALEILQELVRQKTIPLEIRIVDKAVNILRTIRMSKDDIAAMFETDFTNPAAEKEGNYLEELILRRARIIVKRARVNLVELMKDWLKENNPRLVISIAQELKLTELIPDLEILREQIIQNETPGMMQWELRYVDEAIKILQES